MSAPWLVPPMPAGQVLGLDAAALLLESAGQPAPGRGMLAFVNQVAPVEYLSVLRYADEGPVLEEGHAHGPGVANITGDCFARYRAQFAGVDQATHMGQRLRAEAGADAPVLGLNLGSEDLPDAAWRHQIYDRERLAARLTLLYAPRPRSAYAINLYRHQRLGRFLPQEVERLLAVAPLLRLAHGQALALRSPGGGNGPASAGLSAVGHMPRSAAPPAVPLPIDDRVAHALQRLRLRAPALSPREAEVCARIACGISVDGMAADLGVAPSTVATLRKRAYAKLAGQGVHNRLALVHLLA